MSLKTRIKDFLYHWSQTEPRKYINGGEIEREALAAGYKASNASRRLRELVNEGKAEKRLNSKGHVEYRYIPSN